MSRKSKKQMLEEMEDNGWDPCCDERDSYEDVKSAYDTYLNATANYDDSFTDGRDYDAEDEDEPF